MASHCLASTMKANLKRKKKKKIQSEERRKPFVRQPMTHPSNQSNLRVQAPSLEPSHYPPPLPLHFGGATKGSSITFLPVFSSYMSRATISLQFTASVHESSAYPHHRHRNCLFRGPPRPRPHTTRSSTISSSSHSSSPSISTGGICVSSWAWLGRGSMATGQRRDTWKTLLIPGGVFKWYVLPLITLVTLYCECSSESFFFGRFVCMFLKSNQT